MPLLHYHLDPKHTSLRNKAQRSPFHLMTKVSVPRLSYVLTSCSSLPQSPKLLPYSTFSVHEDKHVHNLLGSALRSFKDRKLAHRDCTTARLLAQNLLNQGLESRVRKRIQSESTHRKTRWRRICSA